MSSSSNQSDSFPYPRGSVVGILIDDAAFDDARQRLERAGFGADRCDVLQGDEGLARIDVEGEAHGMGGPICAAPGSAERRCRPRPPVRALRPVTTSSASRWATMRRPSNGPRMRFVRRTRSPSTTTPKPTSRTSPPTPDQGRERAENPCAWMSVGPARLPQTSTGDCCKATETRHPCRRRGVAALIEMQRSRADARSCRSARVGSPLLVAHGGGDGRVRVVGNVAGLVSRVPVQRPGSRRRGRPQMSVKASRPFVGCGDSSGRPDGGSNS